MVDSSFPPVTLIIPNFNGACLLRKNIPFVIAAAERYPGKSSIIVVDDGSRDDSVQILHTEFPSICVVEHVINQGFAEAIHSGVSTASTELLVFLNSDVRPDPAFLVPLLRHFQRPEVFSVTPLIMDENSHVSPVSWRCFRISGGRLRTLRWQYDKMRRNAQASLFASGGSMALRKSMFLDLDGFLPIFRPFYSEDADLGIRAWRRGWETLLDPTSWVVHERTGSIKENISKAKVRMVRVRNQFILEWIHVPGKELILFFLPRYLLQFFVRLVTLDIVSVRASFAALRKLPQALKVRYGIRQNSVLSFWEVIRIVEEHARLDDASAQIPSHPK